MGRHCPASEAASLPLGAVASSTTMGKSLSRPVIRSVRSTVGVGAISARLPLQSKACLSPATEHRGRHCPGSPIGPDGPGSPELPRTSATPAAFAHAARCKCRNPLADRRSGFPRPSASQCAVPSLSPVSFGQDCPHRHFQSYSTRHAPNPAPRAKFIATAKHAAPIRPATVRSDRYSPSR